MGFLDPSSKEQEHHGPLPHLSKISSPKVNQGQPSVTLNIAGGRKMDPVIEDVFPIKNRDIPLLLLMV